MSGDLYRVGPCLGKGALIWAHRQLETIFLEVVNGMEAQFEIIEEHILVRSPESCSLSPTPENRS